MSVELNKIPSVNELAESKDLKDIVCQFGREIVVGVTRQTLEAIRQQIKKGKNKIPQQTEIIAGIKMRVIVDQKLKLSRAINATGIILHTNLGRAPLAGSVIETISRELSGYCLVELDRETGERSIREKHIEDLLIRLSGCEAATVVNNNAGATLIALSELAKGKEVIVSRGQLIEIGGSFRMPEVMQQSGAKLVEVGTTNKTYLKDYEGAISENTALLLHVHTSNYRIVGFTGTPQIEDLVKLGRSCNIPVMDDLGSGLLFDLSQWGIADEPTVQRSVKAGADIITFSADKLLGGPQGGIIIGKKNFVSRIRKNPLFRALRPCKLTLVALEATLKLFLNKETLFEKLPTLRMITISLEELESRAQKLCSKLKSIKNLTCQIQDDFSEAGGGSMPAHKLKTKVVTVRHKNLGVDELAGKLRLSNPPVIVRISHDTVILDLRTILESEIEEVALAFKGL